MILTQYTKDEIVFMWSTMMVFHLYHGNMPWQIIPNLTRTEGKLIWRTFSCNSNYECGLK